MRGNQLWANLIALEEGDEVALGIVNLPALGVLCKASRQGGAYRNDSPMQVSSRKTAEESVLCFNDFRRLDGFTFKDKLLEWMPRFWAVRGMGGASDAMMVAAGQAEVWVELHAAAWDFAPLKVIVEESGGRFLNFDGGSSIYGGNAVVFTPGFETEVRELLGS